MSIREPSTRGSWMLYAGIGLGILLIAAAVSLYIVFFKGPADLARATADGIKEVFNFTPRVTINETVVIEEVTPILEVAIVERPLLVDYKWSHTWLGSTKTLHLRGSFTAKAGFNLKEPFTINIDRKTRDMTAILPEPRLLSMEMTAYQVLEDESGWWNSISGQDRQEAVLRLHETARRQVLSSGLLADAQQTARARITEILERNGATAEFIQRKEGIE